MTALLYTAIDSSERYAADRMYREDAKEDLEDFTITLAASDLCSDTVTAGAVMIPERPPAFDGRMSWFTSEEFPDDKDDSLTLTEELGAPALKNRLYGDANV